MSSKPTHHTINYIEFSTTSIAQTKKLYGEAFGWTFQDWGPDYISIAGGGVEGGFRTRQPHEQPGDASPLVVLYSADLKATEAAIVKAGGVITVPTFEFPGGRRFHFSDGAGNVLGVWSE